MSSVSVIIPALDEAPRIEGAVRSALDAGAAEVIVADGGSRDATAEIARAAGATLARAEGVRGARLNAAARGAAGEVLMFLHADTLLPPGAATAAAGAIEAGAVFGGFRIRFAEPHRRLRLAAALINARTRFTRAPWGDQAQFVRRELFLESGGFLAIPLMEDYELARRMKKLGPITLLPLEVTTSGRRFLENGLFRTAAINWWTILQWRMGVPAERLAARYRRGASWAS
ncbi:MAG TPA: TIGR04283 family arsenosugar biosynthesis glycosyltransferase [Thermoanaerobaculia bacterium]|nr:TIGR04283 family arsenosugar biosynthesis glycosyltransferase [Thermoanaerobaculia bacterium]